MTSTVYSTCEFGLTKDLLDRIVPSKFGGKRKKERDLKTARKYRIATPEAEEEKEEDGEFNSPSDEEGEINTPSDDHDDESEFQGFSDASDITKPSSTSTVSRLGNYVPPAARKTPAPLLSESEEDPRLRKQVQGILNRYSPRLPPSLP